MSEKSVPTKSAGKRKDILVWSMPRVQDQVSPTGAGKGDKPLYTLLIKSPTGKKKMMATKMVWVNDPEAHLFCISLRHLGT